MKEKTLYFIWALLYAICAALGFYGETEGIGKVLFVLVALIFFLPGVGLLVLSYREKNKEILRRIRWISIVWLVLTFGLLIANVAVAVGTDKANNFLHILLTLCSAPMLCGQYYAMSLFLWACLLFATFIKLPKEK